MAESCFHAMLRTSRWTSIGLISMLGGGAEGAAREKQRQMATSAAAQGKAKSVLRKTPRRGAARLSLEPARFDRGRNMAIFFSVINSLPPGRRIHRQVPRDGETES